MDVLGAVLLQELEAMKQKLKELEEEAAKLRNTQVSMLKSCYMSAADSPLQGWQGATPLRAAPPTQGGFHAVASIKQQQSG